MFKLKTKFDPKGDQVKAIKSLVKGVRNREKGQVLLGATGTGKTFTMANIINETQKPALIMCHNKTLAAQLTTEFQEFFPDNAVCYFVSYYDYYQPEAYVSKTDTYIEKETSINEEIEKYRHLTTSSLLTRKDVIIIASVSAIYGLGDKEAYLKNSVNIKRGDSYLRNVLLRRLTDIQYTRSIGEFKRGMFNVLGDTVEIYPPDKDIIFRLEFFGDELEKIEELDAFTGELLLEKEKIEIFPASHTVTDKEKIEKAVPLIRKDLELRYKFFLDNGMRLEAERIKTRTEYDIEMLLETGYTNGIENYIRYLNNNQKAGDPPPTLLDYFPQDFLMFIDESHITVPQIGGMFNGNYIRKKNLVDHGFRLPSAFDNRPLKFNEFEKYLKNTVFVSATPRQYEYDFSNNKVVEQIIRPTGLLDPKIEVRDSMSQVEDVLEEINLRIKKNERVLITTTTKKLAEKMSDYLMENDIKAQYLHSEIDTLDRVEILKSLRFGGENQGIDVIVGINLLREGLDLPEVSLVAVFDADKEGFLRSRDALIQVSGRAARNAEGKVIFYARKKDEKNLNITKAMKECINETERRREVQIAYNKKHNIVPQTIKKDIVPLRKEKAKLDLTNKSKKLNEKDLRKLKETLIDKMNLAVSNLEFEKAAELRDEIDLLGRDN
jgi:excinuclease ABC subunit B